MTNTATLNASSKNTINYAGEKKRLKIQTITNFCLKLHNIRTAIIKQSKTKSRERENYKIILTNKGKRKNNDYLTIYVSNKITYKRERERTQTR